MQYLIGTVVGTLLTLSGTNPLEWSNPGILIIPVLILVVAGMLFEKS